MCGKGRHAGKLLKVFFFRVGICGKFTIYYDNVFESSVPRRKGFQLFVVKIVKRVYASAESFVFHMREQCVSYIFAVILLMKVRQH